MPEIVLTKEQQNVVDNRGGTLLVSAAAGSGKTKVLIDHVLKRVTEEGCNVDDFLLITFTQAAAAELRGKLLAGLSEKLSQRPEDRHLQRQLGRVYLAQISTVHAFCAVLLREYAHGLELPSDFSVCDEQENLLLRRIAMDRTMESAYINPQEHPQIQMALDMLGGGRDDRRLPDLILKLYLSLQCYPDAEKRSKELEESLEVRQYTDAGETIWGAYLIREFQEDLEGWEARLKRAKDCVCQTEALAPYAPVFSANLELLQRLRKEATSWEGLHCFEADFGRLTAIRKCGEPELQRQVQAVRKRVSSQVQTALSRFSLSSREALEDLSINANALKGLLELTRRFSAEYQQIKRRRHVLDYNDLEHETLKLLLDLDGLPSAEAREIADRYVEIMVDEYQDTNAVQDSIFRAISKGEKNLFFVGDVKQSIYRFRMADPGIFLKKYHSFAPYGEATEGAPRKVLLSDNFRSHPAILSGANSVFRLCMTQRVGGLYYGDAEALRPNWKKSDPPTPPVELHCIDMDTVEETVEREEIEAEFVARRIHRMLREGEQIPDEEGLRPIRPEDIVILFRSLSGKAGVYMQALAAYGIPCLCGEDALFETEEITVLHSLLQILDNPHQDIPLLGVLFSPLFCFSPQTMALLRSKDRKGNIYTILNGCEEGRQFLQTLSLLRDQAQYLSLRELLEELDERLHLRILYGAMEGGERRLAHLERFFSFADQYETSGRYGLAGFLRYLEAMKERGLAAEQENSGDAVRLMTVHKSKGLEFPVVFLADLGKRFNLQDAYDPILVDPVLGIASGIYDPEQRVSYPTIAKHAISHRIKTESVSEEMRVLYVAMTRAKCRLIMSYCGKGLEKRLNTYAKELTVPAEDALLQSVSCMGDWILLTALTRTESGELFAHGGDCPFSGVSEHPWRCAYHSGEAYLPGEAQTESGETEKQQEEMLRFRPLAYPHPVASRTPTKMTATQLKGTDLSENKTAPKTQRRKKPLFRPGERPLTAAQRGTAIHLAMQFVRYENCKSEEGVAQELRRLLEQQFLTPQQYAAVPAEKLLRFFRSPLGERVLRGEKLIREFKFSIQEDGSRYDPALSGEKILLQGVTDCCWMEEDGLVVLDFKSDSIAPGQEAERGEYYRGQLEAYGRALGRIFQCPVKECLLYFFATDTPWTLK